MSKGLRRELLVEATNARELVQWAKAVPTPRRDSGGKHDSSARERFTLAQWIKGSAVGDILTEFPVKIWDVEAPAHPDFLIEMENFVLGVEATEVTDPLVERAQKIAHRREILMYSSPRPGVLPATASDDEIAAYIQDFGMHPPWTGTDPEKELLRLVRERLLAKRRSAKAYPPLQSSVLLLWDDSGTLANGEILEESGLLAEMRNLRREFGTGFSHVFLVMNGQHWPL